MLSIIYKKGKHRISKTIKYDCLNHHLIKCILLSLEKINSKELYFIQLTLDFCKPASQIYFEKHFNDSLEVYLYSSTHCNLWSLYTPLPI